MEGSEGKTYPQNYRSSQNYILEKIAIGDSCVSIHSSGLLSEFLLDNYFFSPNSFEYPFSFPDYLRKVPLFEITASV